MMRRLTILASVLLAMGLAGWSQARAQAPSDTQTKDQGADPTQSFVSPLGLGTGATLQVTSKGTAAAAAIERQVVAPVNFWQLGFSGTLDKNGQQQVYSSSDRDAPGFKAKIGIGYSSFIKLRPLYTATGGDFVRQAWCRDLLGAINKTLGHGSASVPRDADCAAAVSQVRAALAKSPPADHNAAALDQKVVAMLDSMGTTVTMDQQLAACNALKDQAALYQFCPAKLAKSVEEQRRNYPELYSRMVLGQPSPFQWKAWASWGPTLTSVDYRSVQSGVADLATKLQWTRLLNSALGDVALYYGKFALGVEGGYGQTVAVRTQNVCSTTPSGAYAAQQCDVAMIGQPSPTDAWLGSATLDVYPLPGAGDVTFFNPGAQIVFSYVAPTTGGHASEIAVPFYLAPSAAPMKLVFGLQPTWDWNTNPKVGNRFSVALFVGARPTIGQ